MKTKLFTFSLLLTALQTFSQDFNAAAQLNFENTDDFKKHESLVLQCANYVLSTPVNDEDKNRVIALQAIIKWMSGTPDYNFVVDESIGDLIENNDEVLAIYMTCMTKYALENPEKAGNVRDVKLNAFNLLLTYCENKSNNIRQTREVQKAIASKNKGELEKYLKL